MFVRLGCLFCLVAPVVVVLFLSSRLEVWACVFTCVRVVHVRAQAVRPRVGVVVRYAALWLSVCLPDVLCVYAFVSLPVCAGVPRFVCCSGCA